MKIYGIYDEKLEDYCEVFHMPTDLAAIRGFGEQCNNEKTPLYKHPEDYKLVLIFNSKTEELFEKELITAEECIKIRENSKNEKNS